jgi:hypothetical protein
VVIHSNGEITRPNVTAIQREAEQREAWCAATLLYIGLEVTQSCTDIEKRLSLRKDFSKYGKTKLREQ